MLTGEERKYIVTTYSRISHTHIWFTIIQCFTYGLNKSMFHKFVVPVTWYDLQEPKHYRKVVEILKPLTLSNPYSIYVCIFAGN